MPELNNILLTENDNLSPAQKDSLQEYMTSISFLASKKLNLEFNNKDQFHAAAVMSEIFKNAESSIKIFTGSFSGEVSNNPAYLDSLRMSINGKPLAVEVVFENTPNEDSHCLALLRDLKSQGKNISMFSLKPEYSERLRTKHNIVLHHFTVADEQMFRYETDKIQFKAFCNFDDKEKSATLSQNFAILKLNSSSLQ